MFLAASKLLPTFVYIYIQKLISIGWMCFAAAVAWEAGKPLVKEEQFIYNRIHLSAYVVVFW